MLKCIASYYIRRPLGGVLDTVGRFNHLEIGWAAAGAERGYPGPFVLLEQNLGCSCVVASHTAPSVFLVFFCLDLPGRPGPPLDPLDYTPKLFLLRARLEDVVHILPPGPPEPWTHAPTPCLDPLKLVLLTVLDLCLFYA